MSADGSGVSSRVSRGMVVAVLVLAAGFGVWRLVDARSADAPEVTETMRPTPVRVAVAEVSGESRIAERFAGLTTARRQSALGFDRSGLVEAVYVDLGDDVAAGDLLAELDMRTLRADIAAARARIKEIEADLTLARATADRQRQLVDQGHVSVQRFDEATAQVDATQARLVAADADLDALEARLALGRMRAPYAGRIIARMIDEGAAVDAGRAVLELMEAGALEIRVGLPARAAGDLAPGDRYGFDGPTGAFEAILRAQTGQVDRATQTVAAVFDVSPDQAARGGVQPGAVARLKLNRALEEAGLWAPISALIESRRGLWTLNVLEPTEEADVFVVAPRAVEVLHTESARAYVRGAVGHGERFIAVNASRAAPGQRVTLADEPAAPPPTEAIAEVQL